MRLTKSDRKYISSCIEKNLDEKVPPNIMNAITTQQELQKIYCQILANR
eukprot:UN22100